MTPEQTERLFLQIGRIEQAIESHRAETLGVHTRHERELNDLDVRVGTNEKQIARARGWGAGIGSTMAAVIALLGIEQFWR